MGITKRFIYLLLLGLGLLIVTSIWFNPVFIFIGYNLLCGGLLLADYLISPAEIPVKIEFTGPEKLSLYEEETISFQLINQLPYQLEIKLKDELPDYHFQAEDELMTGSLAPNEQQEFRYRLVPTKRGIFKFERVYCKISGRLKLCTKSFTQELARELKVYPSRKNIARHRLMMFNNRFYKQGRRSIRRQGTGTSFASLREYVSGDDYKKINWKATARMNKPILNQYQPEKNQHVYILIDTGRPMSYTVKGYRKLDLAVNTAVVLSDIVNQKGDQSAVFTFNTEVEKMVLPGKGQEHRNKIMEALYRVEAGTETSNYKEAFYQLKKRDHHRSIIFLFTDFETEAEAENILRLLPQISRNNIVVLPLMRDEKLTKLTSSQPQTTEEMFNKGVALELLNERQRIIKLLNRRGVFCFESPAEKLDYSAINKYIELKNELYF